MATELPDWAERLGLSPHPEGGWFAETWRSDLEIPQAALPASYTRPRSAGTAILFLLMSGQQSEWHSVRSAELWLYHRGSPLVLQTGDQKVGATTYLLGADIAAGQQPQVLVPGGHWQRARPRDDEPTLVSCIVVPGFDFADFTLEPTEILDDDAPSSSSPAPPISSEAQALSHSAGTSDVLTDESGSTDSWATGMSL